MRPVNHTGQRGFHQLEQQADTESTESCSSEEEQANARQEEGVRELAKALMAWDAQLIGPEMVSYAAHPAAGAFAAFLVRLELESRPHRELRLEVPQWLRQIGADQQRREQALETVRMRAMGPMDTLSAIVLYRMMRPCTE